MTILVIVLTVIATYTCIGILIAKRLSKRIDTDII